MTLPHRSPKSLKKVAGMFEYLSFRWDLWRIERADRKVYKKYTAYIEKAKVKNASKDEIGTLEYERAIDGMEYADEIRKLHSRYYCSQAARMLIPTPDTEDKTMWEQESTRRFYLTEKGIMHVRSLVRAERKARLEMFVMWVPGVVGLIGAGIGLASILMKK
jgi:hypothetical protein